MTPELHLYTAATMNGWKPLIFLEEAGLDYELTHVHFSRQEQKAPAYLALNPNGRIPTLVDRGHDDFVVFESGAILWYLAERTGRFLPADPKGRSRTLQWLTRSEAKPQTTTHEQRGALPAHNPVRPRWRAWDP